MKHMKRWACLEHALAKGTTPTSARAVTANRCNRKRLDRLPLGERTDELLPRVLGYYTRLCALPRRTRRALMRQWRRSLSAIALLLALGQAPALAATIAVAPGISPAINADGHLRPHRGHRQRQCRCPNPQRLRQRATGPTRLRCHSGARSRSRRSTTPPSAPRHCRSSPRPSPSGAVTARSGGRVARPSFVFWPWPAAGT